jgi:pyridoxamine 5'-phosphate oxidase
MTDDEFLGLFESAALEEFRHADHVRAAFAYVERDGPDRALPAMLAGIRRFAAAKGDPGKFHYTLTRAWLTLIVEARARHPHARTAAALLNACPLLAEQATIGRFYSPEVLAQDGARAGWLEPDRAPLLWPEQDGTPSPGRPAAEADPLVRFAAAVERAQRLGVDTAPTALATADSAGRPSVRIVLLRGADSRGFVFHTNYNSRKARELTANARAALCLHWPTLEEQIRIEGSVVRLPADESDAYFAGRPRASQLGAWASEQSTVLPARSVLEERIRDVESQFEGRTVPRPPFWGGFRVVPDRIEFWRGGNDRLHDRIVYVRDGDGWRTHQLFP